MGCRDSQSRALAALLAADAYPTAVAVTGAPGTGKTTTLRAFLDSQPFATSWVQCDQCATARVLLQRALRLIFAHTGTGTSDEAVCENVDVFYTLIAAKFRRAHFTRRHVLVLDRLDQLHDYRARENLFSSLARLPELADGLRNLVVVFVYSTPEPRALVTNPGVPHVWFPRFTFDEALHILAARRDELCPAPAEAGPDFSTEFKTDYLELVAKMAQPYAGTDIKSLARVAARIWPQFVAGEDAGTDPSVARVYGTKARLLQSEMLLDTVPLSSVQGEGPVVSPLSCYLLCAAYLASYNPPRYDMRYFSQAKAMRNKRRETKPKKSATIPPRSLAAPAFEMERLLAIFHALNPMGFEFQPSVDLGREIATLAAHNLLTKSQGDPLDSRTKWKANVSWSYVQRLADDIGFPIEDYLVE